ncbi:MAG: AAA family ATPase, partial [Planctomycetota bacterium]|nr:AAA family ATPase [Planctomycetota bacterium]
DESSISENNRVFSNQKLEIESQLRDITSRISQFIIEHGITADNPRDFPEAQTLAGVMTTINKTREAYSIQQSIYAQLQLKLQGTMEPSHEDKRIAELDPRIINMNYRVDERRTKQRELNRIYTPDHPEVVKIEQEVLSAEEERDMALDEIIQQNLLALQKTTSDDIENLGTLLDQYEEDAEDMSKRLQELTADHTEYQALETERRQLEEERHSKVKLIGELTLMRLRADAKRVRVAQAAIPPRELSFPKPEYMLPLGVLLVLGSTLGWIFFRELTDRRIKSASDLSIIPGVSILGSIPDLEDDPTRTKTAELVVRNHPASVMAETYRQACTAMCRTVEQNGYQSLVFFSALPNAGNTTSITNFACVLSAMGKKVCVIDADFRRPRLAKAFGLDPDHLGLGDLLAEKAELNDVVQKSDGIDVIAAGTPSERVIERLVTSRLSKLLAELRDRYDLILFDSPPAVVAGDALSVANHVDATVMVVRANREQRGLVARLIGQFNSSPSKLIGIVLNRPLSSAGGYYKKNYAVMAKYSLNKTD